MPSFPRQSGTPGTPAAIRRHAALFALAMTLGLLIPSLARAAHPCPNGPGPGEVQVGTAGGSHGIASYPVCESTGAVGMDDSPPPAQTYDPEVPIDNYIAVAWHPDADDVWATWGHYRQASAETAVLQACNATQGGECTIAMAGRNMTIVVGRNASGRLHLASGAGPRKARAELKRGCDKCTLLHTFDAPTRSEPSSNIVLRESIDRMGVFKKYHYPGYSRVRAPEIGDEPAAPSRGLPPGMHALFSSPQGRWSARTGDGQGFDCSIHYDKDGQSITFLGPSRSGQSGGILFSGQSIPNPATPAEVRIAMSGDKGRTELKAMHMPTRGTSGVIVVSADMAGVAGSLSDSSPIAIELAGRQVLRMQIEGGTIARTELQHCMQRK